jgi:hypothetical protein
LDNLVLGTQGEEAAGESGAGGEAGRRLATGLGKVEAASRRSVSNPQNRDATATLGYPRTGHLFLKISLQGSNSSVNLSVRNDNRVELFRSYV